MYQATLGNLKAGTIMKLGVPLLVLAAVTMALVGRAWADGESHNGNVSAVGKAEPKIILTLGVASVSLTGVDPDCAAVGGTTSYEGESGNEGCAYVWTLSVQVESNRAWKGTLKGSDNGQPTSEVTIDDSAFHVSTSPIQSYSDCTGAEVVPNDDWTWENSGHKGNTIATHYQCAVVDWNNDDGSIDSTISYSVSQ